MIEAIVFDFGNVIGFFDHLKATRRLSAYAGAPADVIYSYLIGGALEDDYEAGRISTVDYLRGLRKRFGFECADELLADAYGDIFEANRDVCALLPLLKPRYRLLLGSNTTELHARWFRRQFADTLGRFDALVLSYEIGARKPGAAFFEHCARAADARPEECLFIDDLPANVAGARACGWQGVVYAGIESLRRDLAGLGVQVGEPAGTPWRPIPSGPWQPPRLDNETLGRRTD